MSGLSILVLKEEVQDEYELEALLDKTKSPVGERSVTALLASDPRVRKSPRRPWVQLELRPALALL